jgi:hypothetical protein
MKNTKFSLLFLALFATAALAEELPLRYEVSYQRAQGGHESSTLGTRVGATASMATMTENLVVSEVDNKLGTLSAKFAVRKSGTTVELTPESVQADGVITQINYTVWEKGLAVAQGRHQVLLTKGKRVDLPAVADEQVSVCLVD